MATAIRIELILTESKSVVLPLDDAVLVLRAGVEPALPQRESDFKSDASTYLATGAFKLVPQVGYAPTTYGLQDRCSTE